MNSPQQRYHSILNQIDQENSFLFANTLLKRAAHTFNNKIALLCNKESLSYTALYEQSLRLTNWLLKNNIQMGDRVALLCENSIIYYALYFGIWQTGAVIVPINTFLSEREITHIMQDAEVRFIITSTVWFEKLTNFTLPFEHINGQLIVEQNTMTSTPHISIPKSPDDLAILLYTSGTTGLPKGVMLSYRALMTNVAQILSCANLIKPDDRIYAVLPLFHSFAQNTCIWSSIFVGVTIIIVPHIDRKHILEGFNHKPTAVVGVPALYGLLCLMKTVPLDSVRYFISGGDALPSKISMAFELIYQRKLCNGYGLTEAAPFIAVNLDDDRYADGTVGLLAPGIEARLCNQEGKTISSNSTGILHIKGNNLMMGYFKSPSTTTLVLNDGWLNTGDLATFDSTNRLRIVGREKDLIIHKGFNIYPLEIENVLMSHPQVVRAAVIGITDENGETPIAFVVAKLNDHSLPDQLKSLCKQELALYKHPKKIIIVSDLPVNGMGKIDKKILKSNYEASSLHQKK